MVFVFCCFSFFEVKLEFVNPKRGHFWSKGRGHGEGEGGERREVREGGMCVTLTTRVFGPPLPISDSESCVTCTGPAHPPLRETSVSLLDLRLVWLLKSHLHGKTHSSQRPSLHPSVQHMHSRLASELCRSACPQHFNRCLPGQWMWPRSLRRTMLTASSTAWWTQPLGTSCPQDTLPQTAHLALTIVFRTFRRPLFGTPAVGSVTTLREAPHTQRLHNPCSWNWSWSLGVKRFYLDLGDRFFVTLVWNLSVLSSFVRGSPSQFDWCQLLSISESTPRITYLLHVSHTARFKRGFWGTGSRSLYTVPRHELLSLTPDCRHFMNRCTFSRASSVLALHCLLKFDLVISSPNRTPSPVPRCQVYGSSTECTPDRPNLRSKDPSTSPHFHNRTCLFRIAQLLLWWMLPGNHHALSLAPHHVSRFHHSATRCPYCPQWKKKTVVLWALAFHRQGIKVELNIFMWLDKLVFSASLQGSYPWVWLRLDQPFDVSALYTCASQPDRWCTCWTQCTERSRTASQAPWTFKWEASFLNSLQWSRPPLLSWYPGRALSRQLPTCTCQGETSVYTVTLFLTSRTRFVSLWLLPSFFPL